MLGKDDDANDDHSDGDRDDHAVVVVVVAAAVADLDVDVSWPTDPYYVGFHRRSFSLSMRQPGGTQAMEWLICAYKSMFADQVPIKILYIYIF